MSLSAIGMNLLIPPLNLVPLGFVGLVLACRWRRVGLAVVAAAMLGLFLLATPNVSGFLIASLERRLPLTPPAEDPPQAIVILSAELVRDAGPDRVRVGPLTLEREQAGAALARRTGLPILVTGGTWHGGPETLGSQMALSLAADFGTPVRWTEAASDDTWENATLSAAILKADNIHSIYLVTHAWHMQRALVAFATTGITVTAAPVRMDAPPLWWPSGFEPRADAWLASFYAIHEWIGLADYTWFKGS